MAHSRRLDASAHTQRTVNLKLLKSLLPDPIFKALTVCTPRSYAPADLYPASLVDAQLAQPFTAPGFAAGEIDTLGTLNLRYTDACRLATQNKTPHTVRLQDLTPLPQCLLFGLGREDFLKALMHKARPRELLILEPDPGALAATLDTWDWQGIITRAREQHTRITLMATGPKAPDAFEALERFYSERGYYLASFVACVLGRRDGLLNEFITNLMQAYPRLYTGLGFFDDKAAGLAQALAAVHAGARFVRDLPRPAQLCKVPLLIVGGGPSLDRDLPHIRRLRPKALIIACGTGLDALYHAGIRPDFYCATERTPEIAKTLSIIDEPGYFDDLVLLGPENLHPNTGRLFRRRLQLCAAREPFYWLLQGAPLLQPLACGAPFGPLVGNCALTCALELGFEEIYLFGLDCGTRTGDSVHSRHIHLYHEAGINDKGGTYTLDDKVPANFGGWCLSGRYFKRSRDNLALTLAQYPKARCYNCADGCLIPGATPLEAADINLEGLEGGELERGALIEQVFAQGAPLDASELKLSRRLRLQDFTELCTSYRKLFDFPLTSRGCGFGQMEIISRCLHNLEGSLLHFQTVILEPTLEYLLMFMLKALCEDPDEQAALRRAEQIMAIARAFFSDAGLVCARLPEYIYGEHLKLFGGRVGDDHPGLPAPPAPQESFILDPEYLEGLKAGGARDG